MSLKAAASTHVSRSRGRACALLVVLVIRIPRSHRNGYSTCSRVLVRGLTVRALPRELEVYQPTSQMLHCTVDTARCDAGYLCALVNAHASGLLHGHTALLGVCGRRGMPHGGHITHARAKTKTTSSIMANHMYMYARTCTPVTARRGLSIDAHAGAAFRGARHATICLDWMTA